MGNTDRQQAIDLKQLLDHSKKIPFIQVLRLLRLVLTNREDLSGNDDKVFDFIRIRPELTLEFPSTDVADVEELSRADGDLYRVTATFMGLYGSSSPLPTFYTEDLIEERREDGSITRDFIDVINQPFYVHFFKIWEKYSIGHRLAENPNDRSYQILYNLLGLGEENGRRLLPHGKEFLANIGIATQAPKSASGLRSLVAHLLKFDEVEVEQCVEHIATIPDEQRFFLGRKNHCLGEDSHLGGQILDLLGKFRLCIGPIASQQLQAILPDTEPYGLIAECVKFYLDQPLVWDIELTVRQDEIVTTQLGHEQWAKLGWNSWLFSGENAPCLGQVPLLGGDGQGVGCG